MNVEKKNQLGVLKYHKSLVEENTLNQDIAVLPRFRVETTGVMRYGPGRW
jgi:hypothetical protein